MLTNGHSKKSNFQDVSGIESSDENRGTESVSQQNEEQEAARSLLHLSAIGEPSQWSNSTGKHQNIPMDFIIIIKINNFYHYYFVYITLF